MKNLSILLAAVVIFCVAGCKTTTAPTSSGSFAGRVLLFDSTGAALPDFSGTSVVLDGTSFSTTTDSLGQWQIAGVPEGQYNVTASKSGFGTFHWYEQVMVGGTLDLKAAGIARMSNFAPVLTSAVFSGSTLSYGIQSLYTIPPIAIYCDLDSTTLPWQQHLVIDPGVGYFTYDELRAAGARSGETIYISTSTVFLIGNSPEGYSATFFDPMHNETRYASTGPKSNVIAVKMP